MEDPSAKPQGKIWPQVLSAMIVNLGALVTGAVISWPTMALPELPKDSRIQGLTDSQLSWLAAITPVGAVLSSFPARYAVDHIGSRSTMLVVTLPLVAGWMLMYCSSSFAMLLSEIADANIRGALVSAFDLMICVGILLISIIVTFASWRTLSLVSAALPLIFHIFMIIVPESPRFLMSKGRDQEAAKNLMKLRRLPKEFAVEQVQEMAHEHELMANTASKDSEKVEKKDKTSLASTLSNYKELLKPSVLNSLWKCFVLRLLQVFSGIGPITAYAIEVFESSDSGVDAHLANILVVVVQITASLISMALVDRIGRKLLLIASSALVCLSNAALGSFFYWKDHGDSFVGTLWASFMKWLPLACVMGVMAGYSIGVGPVPNSILSEMLPQNIRGVASSLIRISRAVAAFLVTKYFKSFISFAGASSAYWVFASWCFAGIIFVYVSIPETSGKSLEEIQKTLHHKKKVRSQPEESFAEVVLKKLPV